MAKKRLNSLHRIARAGVKIGTQVWVKLDRGGFVQCTVTARRNGKVTIKPEAGIGSSVVTIDSIWAHKPKLHAHTQAEG